MSIFPSKSAMIRVIHQTWKDSFPPDPPFKKEWRESWQALNPHWEYKLWTDLDIEAFVRTEFPGFHHVWLAYPKPIMRVDAWRYLLLWKQGGLYVDLDFACLRPLDEWLPITEHFCVASQGDGCWGNSFMWASNTSCRFFEDIGNALVGSADQTSVLHATGPNFLTEYGKSHGDGVIVLPPASVFPIPWWDKEGCVTLAERSLREIAAQYADSNAVTFWTNTWSNQDESI